MDPEDIEFFKVRWNENDEEENTPLSGLKKIKKLMCSGYDR